METMGHVMGNGLALLDACPKSLRGWEWQYVWRQCHLALGTYQQSGETLNGVAFSPDSTRVAAVSGAFMFQRPAGMGDLVVRDVGTGQETFACRNVASGYRGGAFSPDSRWIAVGNASNLVILNAATGKEEFRLPHPTNRSDTVLSLAFSPDSKRIIARYGQFVRSQFVGHANLWDLTSSKLITTIPESRGGNCIAFSPDGREVAVARVGLVELWDLKAAPERIRSIPCHGGTVFAVAFSPDGRYLASGGLDRAIRLWDHVTGKEICAFFGHEGFIRGLAFSPNGRWIVSASEDYSVKLWEIDSGRPLASFPGHQSFATCMAFSRDEQIIASGGQDRALILWSASLRSAWR
jgi:eukaryotic-like serine/threonine-protein kinase